MDSRSAPPGAPTALTGDPKVRKDAFKRLAKWPQWYGPDLLDQNPGSVGEVRQIFSLLGTVDDGSIDPELARTLETTPIAEIYTETRRALASRAAAQPDGPLATAGSPGTLRAIRRLASPLPAEHAAAAIALLALPPAEFARILSVPLGSPAFNRSRRKWQQFLGVGTPVAAAIMLEKPVTAWMHPAHEGLIARAGAPLLALLLIGALGSCVGVGLASLCFAEPDFPLSRKGTSDNRWHAVNWPQFASFVESIRSARLLPFLIGSLPDDLGSVSIGQRPLACALERAIAGTLAANLADGAALPPAAQHVLERHVEQAGRLLESSLLERVEQEALEAYVRAACGMFAAIRAVRAVRPMQTLLESLEASGSHADLAEFVRRRAAELADAGEHGDLLRAGSQRTGEGLLVPAARGDGTPSEQMLRPEEARLP